MTRTIGGTLDMKALSRLHFHSLDGQEQGTAIRRMAGIGQGEHTIARATGLSVEFIRRVLSDQPSTNSVGGA